MRRIHRASLLVAAFALSWGLPPTGAQEDSRPRSGFSAILDNLDLLIDNYTRMLVRKYDLTQEQGDLTREMLREKVTGFLLRHEDEVRALLDEMYEVRSGGEIDQNGLIAWGKRVMPLFNEAKQLIVSGNAEWRQILTDEQRRIHDEDLRLMYESFENTEQQLQRIITGDMTVEEFRNPPRPTPRQSPRANPPRSPRSGVTPQPGAATPVQPASAGQAAQPQPPATPGDGTAVAEQPGHESPATHTGGQPPATTVDAPGASHPPTAQNPPGARGAAGPTQDYEDEWERYVREFIEKYQLTNEQADRARAILKDCKEQAARIMKTRTPALEQIDRQIAELTRPEPSAAGDRKGPAPDNKARAERLAELNKSKQKLLEPLTGIFEDQLKPRLETLPTRAQRRAAEATTKPASAKPRPAGKDAKK